MDHFFMSVKKKMRMVLMFLVRNGVFQSYQVSLETGEKMQLCLSMFQIKVIIGYKEYKTKLLLLKNLKMSICIKPIIENSLSVLKSLLILLH